MLQTSEVASETEIMRQDKIVTIPDEEFRKIYIKSTYEVETEDGWTLVITRYKPLKQDFEQPLFNIPLLLVHGFSQNRLTWTSGEFVKNMIFFGVDVHILELRGHGRSSVDLQYLKHHEGKPLPRDIDYNWSVDSYFMYDIPAAIKAVKRVTGFPKIFYCGHSMGGMLGYCYASKYQDDLYGLITIGSPAEIGKSSLLLKLGSYMFPFSAEIIDLLVSYVNLNRKLSHRIEKTRKKIVNMIKITGNIIPEGKEKEKPEEITFNNIPIDEIFKELASIVRKRKNLINKLPDYFPKLWNPEKVNLDDLLYLLEHGAEKEPRKVVEEFSRWIRRNEFKIYTINYDCVENFKNITIPIAIIFGDEDLFANIRSTKRAYRSVRSDYLLWRPVRGNSHIELTMGLDINQISFDIKNLMEYAIRNEKNRLRKDSPEIERAGTGN